MKTVPVTIQMPLDDIINAIGPEVIRTIDTKRALSRERLKARTELSLRQAAHKLSTALDNFDRSVSTPGERTAREVLMGAARAVRAAHIALVKKV